MPNKTKTTGKKSVPAKAKSRRVSVPANAKIFIVKDGEPYPPGLKEIIDKTVHNELAVIREKEEINRRNATVNAPVNVDEATGRVMGVVMSLNPLDQNKVLARLVRRMKVEREGNVSNVEQHYNHLAGQLQRARDHVYALDSIMAGNAILVD